MAVLWMDNFKNYGSDETLLTNGVYAAAGADVYLVDDPDPLVSGNVLQMVASSFSDRTELRYVLPASKTTFGYGLRFWVDDLPNQGSGSTINNSYTYLGIFRNVSNQNIVAIAVLPTGALRVINKAGTIIGETAGPVITADAWQHLEIKITFNAVTGSVEVRKEGVPVLNLTNVNTSPDGEQCAILAFRNGAATLPFQAPAYIKDFIVWDTAGTYNNDFLGSVIVIDLRPDSDVALNWTPQGGPNGWSILDNVPPQDSTHYIEASDPPPAAYRSTLSNLPPDVTSVRAVMPVVRARKIDGGDGNIQVSIHSGPATQAGADRPITAAFTYWWDIFEEDPNTSAPFTPVAVDALEVSVDRTV